jgi:chromate reductase
MEKPLSPLFLDQFGATRRKVVKPITITGFAGSLRKNSYNKRLLRAAAGLLPEFTQLELLDIDGIPLYNQDMEESRIPDIVLRFKEEIERADAVLITTPEYNHSYPGVLKNAIDWASRPHGRNSFDSKPVAVMSAAPGMFGGVAAQDQLKQVLMALNMHVVAQPAVIVTSADRKFGPNNELIDGDAKRFMRQLLANLVDLTRRLAGSEEPLKVACISAAAV